MTAIVKNECICSLCLPQAKVIDGYLVIPSKINDCYQDKEPKVKL